VYDARLTPVIVYERAGWMRCDSLNVLCRFSPRASFCGISETSIPQGFSRVIFFSLQFPRRGFSGKFERTNRFPERIESDDSPLQKFFRELVVTKRLARSIPMRIERITAN
jgi:hypothetical protein